MRQKFQSGLSPRSWSSSRTTSLTSILRAEGELYVYLWQDTGYFVRMEQELETARSVQNRKTPRRYRKGEGR